MTLTELIERTPGLRQWPLTTMVVLYVGAEVFAVLSLGLVAHWLFGPWSLCFTLPAAVFIGWKADDFIRRQVYLKARAGKDTA